MKCYADHCEWAQFDGHTYHCTVCMDKKKRAGEPETAAMSESMPCYTCVSFRGGECRVICQRYKRWVSERWNAVVGVFRR